MRRPAAGSAPLAELLVLCTANVARSPLLAAMLRAEVARRDLPLEVGSAGTDAVVGQPAATHSHEVAAERGLSLADHRSMPLLATPLTATDLVIGMTRAHRDHVRRRHRSMAARTFTLRELLVLLERGEDDGSLERARGATDPGTRERLAAVAAVAADRRPVRGRRRLDVPDPLGADPAVYDELAGEFADAATRLGAVLFDPAP